MREIPMPPDRRPIAQPDALDAARKDDGLRIRLVQAIWRDEDLPTAAAQTGGFVYEIADRVARAVVQREREIRGKAYREMSERVLLVSEVARGHRCPLCHGRPAVVPHPVEKDPRYRCGGGHVWTPPAVIEGVSGRPETLLRRIAETGELPPAPDRVEAEDNCG